ncbi:hypothetical protein [Oligoflexus sp.]|uniref:hypothetical protein n=1 Tax=Oligoflexus sp. TaxID=1971216 RepID=UPI002D777B66|nr:hypothetical protein [Oligoflexus sp.]
MKLRILAGLMLLASQICQAQAAPDQLHNKFIVQVPYGLSYLDYQLAQPTVLNPIRVLYTLRPSCPIIPSTGVSVKYAGLPGWQATTYQNGGYFQHNNQKITHIRFTLSQYSYQSESCELQILTKAKAPQKEVYAGYLAYEGGFAKDQEIQLIHNFKSDKIRFDVPAFCRGIDFQNVRLKNNEEKFVSLKKTGATTFELGQAQEFGKLVLTLNGPKESCDIPVYIFEDAN